MTKLIEVADKVRAKNAGPYWLTIDIFCGTADAFTQVSAGLATKVVAEVLQAEQQTIKRFDLEDLHVVKFSLPRPYVQGTLADRDMHGASYAMLLSDVEI